MMLYMIAIIGVATVLASLWRRNWIDALLVAVAAAALALVAGRFSLPGEAGTTLAVDAGDSAADVARAGKLTVNGDGLRAAQWHDLPARPLEWTAPKEASLALEFPRRVPLGRTFALTVRRADKGTARLQLLAENEQVIAEARGAGDLTVQWLPPVAERLVLSARLLDKDGKTLAQGPVPFTVEDSAPLKVQGRFGAPSFDLRVLDELLVNSNAVVDSQVILGKTVSRAETAREPMEQADLLIVDAAWFEQASAPARAALLDRVTQGIPLLVLAANARDAAVWSRTLNLSLKAQPENAKTDGPLQMAVAPLNPAGERAGEWTGADHVWTRQWQKGRIGWLGVADWHRYAIGEPQALSMWWQSVLDRVGVRRVEEVEWLAPEEMPLPGQRLAVCARGVRGEAMFPELKQTLAWQRRPDSADASCVAVWPQKPGWLEVRTQDHASAVYVYDPRDWPQWQAAQRREATARYAARTLVAAAPAPRPVPAWPFALLFMAAMLALWWRERR
jgi:hypothetical protein